MNKKNSRFHKNKTNDASKYRSPRNSYALEELKSGMIVELWDHGLCCVVQVISANNEVPEAELKVLRSDSSPRPISVGKRISLAGRQTGALLSPLTNYQWPEPRKVLRR